MIGPSYPGDPWGNASSLPTYNVDGGTGTWAADVTAHTVYRHGDYVVSSDGDNMYSFSFRDTTPPVRIDQMNTTTELQDPLEDPLVDYENQQQMESLREQFSANVLAQAREEFLANALAQAREELDQSMTDQDQDHEVDRQRAILFNHRDGWPTPTEWEQDRIQLRGPGNPDAQMNEDLATIARYVRSANNMIWDRTQGVQYIIKDPSMVGSLLDEHLRYRDGIEWGLLSNLITSNQVYRKLTDSTTLHIFGMNLGENTDQYPNPLHSRYVCMVDTQTQDIIRIDTNYYLDESFSVTKLNRLLEHSADGIRHYHASTTDAIALFAQYQTIPEEHRHVLVGRYRTGDQILWGPCRSTPLPEGASVQIEDVTYDEAVNNLYLNFGPDQAEAFNNSEGVEDPTLFEQDKIIVNGQTQCRYTRMGLTNRVKDNYLGDVYHFVQEVLPAVGNHLQCREGFEWNFLKEMMDQGFMYQMADDDTDDIDEGSFRSVDVPCIHERQAPYRFVVCTETGDCFNLLDPNIDSAHFIQIWALGEYGTERSRSAMENMVAEGKAVFHHRTTLIAEKVMSYLTDPQELDQATETLRALLQRRDGVSVSVNVNLGATAASGSTEALTCDTCGETGIHICYPQLAKQMMEMDSFQSALQEAIINSLKEKFGANNDR